MRNTPYDRHRSASGAVISYIGRASSSGSGQAREPIAIAMSWARKERAMISWRRYSRVGMSPKPQCTVVAGSVTVRAAAHAASTIRASAVRASVPRRSPSNLSGPTSAMVRPASMSGTHASSRA